MQKFDKEYYEKLCEFFNSQDNIVYTISEITDNTEKFLDHVAFYKASRKLDQLEVTLSFDCKQIRVNEFFDNAYNEEIIKEFMVDALGSKLELQQVSAAPTITATPTSSTPKSPWDK